MIYAYDGEYVGATYYEGFGWYGDLTTMEPGKGYYYMATESFIWVY